MAEVTGPQAAEILGKSLPTIHRKVDDGTLRARQEGSGERKFLYIDVSELERFATEHGYRFNETLAKQYAK